MPLPRKVRGAVGLLFFVLLLGGSLAATQWVANNKPPSAPAAEP